MREKVKWQFMNFSISVHLLILNQDFPCYMRLWCGAVLWTLILGQFLYSSPIQMINSGLTSNLTIVLIKIPYKFKFKKFIGSCCKHPQGQVWLHFLTPLKPIIDIRGQNSSIHSCIFILNMDNFDMELSPPICTTDGHLT